MAGTSQRRRSIGRLSPPSRQSSIQTFTSKPPESSVGARRSESVFQSERIVPVLPDVDEFLDLVRLQLNVGDFEQVVTRCEAACAVSMLPSLILLLYASALRRTNRFRNAANILNELIDSKFELEVAIWECSICEDRLYERPAFRRGRMEHDDVAVKIARFYMDHLDDDTAFQVLSESSYAREGWSTAPAPILLLLGEIERRRGNGGAQRHTISRVVASGEDNAVAKILTSDDLDATANETRHPLAYLLLADQHLLAGNLSRLALCLRLIDAKFSVRLRLARVDLRRLTLADFTQQRLILANKALTLILARVGPLPRLLFHRANIRKALGWWRAAALDFDRIATIRPHALCQPSDDDVAVKFDQVVFLNSTLLSATNRMPDDVSAAQSYSSALIRTGSVLSVDMMCLKADMARESGSSIGDVTELYDAASNLDQYHVGVQIGQIYTDLYLGDCVNVAGRIVPAARIVLCELARRWRDAYLIALSRVVLRPMPDSFASGDLLKVLEHEFPSFSVRRVVPSHRWRRARSRIRAAMRFRNYKSPLASQLSLLSEQIALVVAAVAEGYFRDGLLASSCRALRLAQRLDPDAGVALQFSLAVLSGSARNMVDALHQHPQVAADAKHPLYRFSETPRLDIGAPAFVDDYNPEDGDDDQTIFDGAISTLNRIHDGDAAWRSQMLVRLKRIRDPDFIDRTNQRVSNLKKRTRISDRRQLSYDLMQRSVQFLPISIYWATTCLNLSIISSDLADVRLARARLRRLDGAVSDLGAAVNLTMNLHVPALMKTAWRLKLVSLQVLYGSLLYRAERFAECEQVLSRALAMNSTHSQALHIRSLCRVKLALFSEAAQDLRHQNDGAMTFLLGQVNLKLGRADDAYDCFRQCIASSPLGPSPKLLLAIGQALVLRQQYADAAIHLGQCVRDDPGCAPAQQLLGDAYVHLQRFREASECFTSLIRLNPTSAEAYRIRGCARLADGDAAGACDDLNRAQMLCRTDTRVMFALAIAYLMRDNAEDAIVVATRCISIGSDQSELYLTRGLALASLQRWHQAISEYTQSLVLQPGNVPCLLAKAYSLFRIANYQSAVYDYTGVLELDPGNIAALANRGAIRELCLNGVPSGIDDLDRAEELDTSGFRVALLKALALKRRLLIADSIAQFNRVLLHYRNSDAVNADDIGAIHNCLGVMFACDTGDAADLNEHKRVSNLRIAFVHFQKAAYRPTLRSVAMQNAAQVLTQLGKSDEALAAFEQSADTGSSSNPLIANNFAVALHRCGNTLQSLKWMRVALASGSDDPVINYNFGAVLTAMGSWRDAIPVLEKSLTLTESADTYNNLGICCHALGRVEDAVANYSKAIELNFEDVAARWNRMLANAARMDFRMALRDNTVLRAKVGDDAESQKVILDRLFEYCRSWQFAFRVLTVQMMVAVRNLPPFSRMDRRRSPMGIVLDSTICEPKRFGMLSSPEHRVLMESVSHINEEPLRNIVLEACHYQSQRQTDRVLHLLLPAVYSVSSDSLRAKLIEWRCVLLLEKQQLDTAESELSPLLENKTKLSASYSNLINLAGLIRQNRGDNDGALSMFAVASDMDPENVIPLMNSAKIYQQTECYFEAFFCITKVVEKTLRTVLLTKTESMLAQTLRTYSVTIQNGTKHWMELENAQSDLAKALHNVVQDSHNAHYIYNVTKQVDQVIEEYLDAFETVVGQHGSLEDYNTENLDALLAESLATMEQAFQNNESLKK